jgi:subtilase family serine protease
LLPNIKIKLYITPNIPDGRILPLPLYIKIFKKIITSCLLILALLAGITASALHSPAVLADGGTDLIVQSISLSPADPAIDDMVTITVTVKNQGTALAGQNYLICYADSTILSTVSINPLNAGLMTTASFNWKAEPGEHTIKAVVDSTGIIAESNETNNTNTYTLTSRAADLVVQSLTWLPSNPSRGDTVVFSLVIKNQGTAISRSTNIDLYIDGNSRGTQDIQAINPGSTLTKTYSWVITAGQHPLKAVADEMDNVRESNESNNEYTATFSTAAPDLIIDKIVWSPLNISKNDTVSLNATVKNQGSGTADACQLAYYIDNELKSTLQVNSLIAGASANISFSFKALSNKHEVKVVIDYYKNVTESDENNNEKTVTLSTLVPDLVVTAITWLPADAAVGDTVSFNATVKNIGGGKSEKSHASWYIDGSFISSPDIPEIPGGEQTMVTIQWVATGGSHAVSFVADPDNMLTESAEDNNKLTVNISIVPPDLYVHNIDWSPTNFTIDDAVTFTANISNQGGGRADDFYVTFYVDDVRLSAVPVGRLNSGSWINAVCTWKATNGRHIFKAVVDEGKAITEENENNNENQVSIAPDMPDLSIETITWSPADIRAGADITYDITIKNLGTLYAGPSRVAYYVDGAAAGYSDIGQVQAGAAVIVHFVWSVVSGQHTINIVADSANKVFELDKNNNTKTVSVPPPDLIVQGITWAPDGASVGDRLVFTAIIKNQGGGQSQSALASLNIDGSPVTVKDLPEIAAAGSAPVTFDWTTTAGKHKIKVTADTSNRVTESDETNNTKEIDFATLTPDLVIQDIGWLMQNPLADDKVDFTVNIKNQGTGNAGACKLKYTVDNLPAIWENIAAIPAGGSAVCSFSFLLKAGSQTVNATIDSYDKINELDETNNTKVLTFNSLAPDLIIQSIGISPVTAIPGDNVTITVKVENRGRNKAPASKLSLSIDGAGVSAADIPAIDVGATLSKDFSWKSLAGQHEIMTYADAGNTILESDETNNSRSRTVTIEKAAAPAPKSIKSNAPAATDKGLISNYWWVLMLAAGLLALGAFVSVYKSVKKG